MNRFVKSGLLFLLGFILLAWFIRSVSQPAMPSETYLMDRVVDVFRLIGAIAGFIGGILELRRR